MAAVWDPSSFPEFPDYYSPWGKPRFYYLFSMALSVLLIAVLFLLSFLFRRLALLPPSFPQMIRIQDGRLKCFDIDISYVKERQVIERSGLWVLRTAVVVVFCFFWAQTMLYSRVYHTEDLSADAAYMFLARQCRSGLQAVSIDQVREFIGLGAFGNQDPLCSNFEPTVDPIWSTMGGKHPRYMMLFGIPRAGGSAVVTALGVAFALFQLVMTVYQIIAWVVFRSRGVVAERIILAVACLCLIGYVALIIVSYAFLFTDWYTTVGLLAVPIILACGRAAGKAVRRVRACQLAASLADTQVFSRASLPRSRSSYHRLRGASITRQPSVELKSGDATLRPAVGDSPLSPTGGGGERRLSSASRSPAELLGESLPPNFARYDDNKSTRQSKGGEGVCFTDQRDSVDVERRPRRRVPATVVKVDT